MTVPEIEVSTMWNSIGHLLAQATQPAGGPGQPGGGAGVGSNIFIGLVLAMVVFYIFMFRGQGRKRREAEKMVQGLKKNDRIQTIGGIIGTVVATKGDEVVVRVDESSNTKMTFVRQSIQRIVSEDSGPTKAS